MSLPVREEFENDDDWTERFIQAVQSKPPIYNTSLPEHSDRKAIFRLWNQVCETMFPAWKDMAINEKSARGKKLQNRWRNLRTCFRRELNKQRQGASGQAAKKRRKYVYFDQLLFLLPTMQDRPTASDCSPSVTEGDNSEIEIEYHAIQTMNQARDDAFNDASQAGASTQQPVRPPTSKRSQAKTKKTPNYEESLLTVLKEMKEEQFDEDKSFLLSLVPSFKKLNDVQKLEAKIEFLGTLKRLAQPSQGLFYCGTQGHETYTSYGPQGFKGNYASRRNPPHHHIRNVKRNSGSSTPIPLLSDASQSSIDSSFDPASSHQNQSDFSKRI